MSDLLPPGIAIAIATVDTPHPSEAGASDRHLIGVALFEVEEAADGFIYRYGARTIQAGATEAILVDWVHARLPEGRIMIGWQLADHIVPALLEASQAAAAEEARAFMDALAAVVSIDAVDLADRGEAAGRTFSELCAAGNIPCWPMTESEVLANWGIGREIELLGSLVTNVIATWRAWAQAERPDDPVITRFAEHVFSTWIVDHDGSVQHWSNGEDA